MNYLGEKQFITGTGIILLEDKTVIAELGEFQS
jgi:hypothetical protein